MARGGYFEKDLRVTRSPFALSSVYVVTMVPSSNTVVVTSVFVTSCRLMVVELYGVPLSSEYCEILVASLAAPPGNFESNLNTSL